VGIPKSRKVCFKLHAGGEAGMHEQHECANFFAAAGYASG
jgi:hypothetical protein